MTISLHYGRAGRRASWQRLCGFRISSRIALAGALVGASIGSVSAGAQYPGQIAKKDKEKEAPVLRAVAVLEWTGDLNKPKTSRLVPVTVFDGEQLQDGGVYLARPQPLAVEGGVEYILQKNGAKIGLFDVKNAGQEQGSWVGFGSWKAMPKPKAPAPVMAKIDDDANSDRPVLHRKKGSGGSGSSTGDSNAETAPERDPDRPTLHKKASDDDAASGTTNSAPPADPDRPTLHKSPDSSAPESSKASSKDASKDSGKDSRKDNTGQASNQSSDKSSGQASSQGSSQDAASAPAADPDRPQLKRGKAKEEAETGYVESLPDISDPDRPRLMRGKSSDGVGPEITPTLMGLPADMEQAVAVSDPRNRPEHSWTYTWADPTDEWKMKAAMEDLARSALGLQAPAAPAVKKAAASKTKARLKPKPVPPEPAPLLDEQFRVFELAYGSGATLVLTARTDGPLAQQKYVTLIAKPDLYGSLLTLFKNVTDGAHLDDRPRMRLVDAVDALADNRGELLFELRGKTQRQFALYRVARGTAEALFVTGGGATSIEAEVGSR
jgi:hypothetical protein